MVFKLFEGAGELPHILEIFESGGENLPQRHGVLLLRPRSGRKNAQSAFVEATKVPKKISCGLVVVLLAPNFMSSGSSEICILHSEMELL